MNKTSSLNHQSDDTIGIILVCTDQDLFYGIIALSGNYSICGVSLYLFIHYLKDIRDWIYGYPYFEKVISLFE